MLAPEPDFDNHAQTVEISGFAGHSSSARAIGTLAASAFGHSLTGTYGFA
jgi:hypothetical protein